MSHRDKVLRSINSPCGLRCLDILRRDTGFGWQHCGRDPEDSHGWRIIGTDSATFDRPEAALSDARTSVGWQEAATA